MAQIFTSQERLNNYLLDYPDAGNIFIVGMSGQCLIEATNGRPAYAVVSGIIGITAWIKSRTMRTNAEEFIENNPEYSIESCSTCDLGQGRRQTRVYEFIQERLIGTGYALMGQGFYNEICGLTSDNSVQVLAGAATSVGSIAVIATGMYLNPEAKIDQKATPYLIATIDEA